MKPAINDNIENIMKSIMNATIPRDKLAYSNNFFYRRFCKKLAPSELLVLQFGRIFSSNHKKIPL